MDEAGSFVKQALPNMNLVFRPNPKYLINFGNYEPGEALNISEITNAQKIEFSPGVFSVTVTLNRYNTWSIT